MGDTIKCAPSRACSLMEGTDVPNGVALRTAACIMAMAVKPDARMN